MNNQDYKQVYVYRRRLQSLKLLWFFFWGIVHGITYSTLSSCKFMSSNTLGPLA
jgi:hypothetical protein